NYDLDTQLDIAAQEGCVATKNGVRDMKRWYVEIPALKEAQPDLQVLSCHDEWLLPTMFDVDGLLVGYGNIAPELLIDLIHAGKAQDYTAARAIFERLLPVTRAVYHRGSHMEGTVALKIGLRHRGLLDHATIREPLKDLGEAAEREIEAAFEAAGIGRVENLMAAE
ncbi:MAG: dihydrodipicolinate synthase family protein, partial [Pseudomonadota bacterium]|nr:dihydrodipicolinate synthase family protein [Pseudomonadota bacterium]